MHRLSRLAPLALSLALAGLMSACKNNAPPPVPEAAEPILQGHQLVFPEKHPQLALLKVTPASTGTTVDLALSAKLVWNESRTQRIYPAFAGRVERIGVDVGETVKPGALLAGLASPDFGQAQADAARARADQAQARQQLQRQRELLEAGIAARRDYEAAEADAARSAAELSRADARVRLYGGAGSVNQQLALRASVAGVVVERNINPGQELRPDQSGPGVPALFVVSDPSTLWVQIDARENEVGAIKVGSKFELEVPAWPGKRFEGTVTAQADAIDANTRTIKIRGTVPNSERLLKAEMLGTAHVQRSLGEGVIVPPTAVLLRGDKQYVFLQPRAGVFEAREVSVGYQGPKQVVVTQGLNAGDRVVSENALLLARQFRIAEHEASPAADASAEPAAAGASRAEARRP